MLVRREAEKPVEHLHRFSVLGLVHACSIADAAHIWSIISPMIPSIHSHCFFPFQKQKRKNHRLNCFDFLPFSYVLSPGNVVKWNKVIRKFSKALATDQTKEQGWKIRMVLVDTYYSYCQQYTVLANVHLSGVRCGFYSKSYSSLRLQPANRWANKLTHAPLEPPYPYPRWALKSTSAHHVQYSWLLRDFTRRSMQEKIEKDKGSRDVQQDSTSTNAATGLHNAGLQVV